MTPVKSRRAIITPHQCDDDAAAATDDNDKHHHLPVELTSLTSTLTTCTSSSAP